MCHQPQVCTRAHSNPHVCTHICPHTTRGNNTHHTTYKEKFEVILAYLASLGVSLEYMRACLKKHPEMRAGELVQWLRALPVLAEDEGFIPSTRVSAQKHLQLQFQGVLCPLLTSIGIA